MSENYRVGNIVLESTENSAMKTTISVKQVSANLVYFQDDFSWTSGYGPALCHSTTGEKRWDDVREVSWFIGTLCSLEIVVPRLHCLQVLVTSWQLEGFVNNRNRVGEKLVSRYIGSGMWHIFRWLRWVLPTIWGIFL